MIRDTLFNVVFLHVLSYAEETGGVTLHINVAPLAPPAHPAMVERAEKISVIKVCLYKPDDFTVLTVILQDNVLSAFIVFNQSFTVRIA